VGEDVKISVNLETGRRRKPQPSDVRPAGRCRLAALERERPPTAIVAPGARLARGEPRPYSVVEEETEIGEGTEVRAHAVVKRYTTLGPPTRSTKAPSWGGAAGPVFQPGPTRLVIGDRNASARA